MVSCTVFVTIEVTSNEHKDVPKDVKDVYVDEFTS